MCIIGRRKAKRNFCSTTNQRDLLQSYKLYLILLVSVWNCGYSPTQYTWVLKSYATTFCFPKCGFTVLRNRFVKSIKDTALGLHSIKWQAKSSAHALFINNTCTTAQVDSARLTRPSCPVIVYHWTIRVWSPHRPHPLWPHTLFIPRTVLVVKRSEHEVETHLCLTPRQRIRGWLRRRAAGFSSQRPGFCLRPVRVAFVMDGAELMSPISSIPSTFHSCSVIIGGAI